MNRTEFRTYKTAMAQATRLVLAEGRSDALGEAAFPAYANPNPLISFLFWQRIRRVTTYLDTGRRFGSALDFGCGGGVLLPFLGGLCRTVVAMDSDLGPHERMRRHVTFPDNITTVDARRTPLSALPSGSFDVILALDVLEHVADLHDTIGHLRRLTTPGGEIIVSGPTENWAYQLGRWIAGPEYSGHYHVRSIDDIRRAMVALTAVRTLAVLYWPVPLFKVLAGRVVNPETEGG